MPPRDLRAYLFDVVECCEAISAYVTGRTLDAYRNERGLRAQVEREFITIGEALNSAVKVDPGIESGITSCRAIIGFRNRLVHGYESVDHETVWEIVRVDVPRLEAEAREALKSAGGS